LLRVLPDGTFPPLLSNFSPDRVACLRVVSSSSLSFSRQSRGTFFFFYRFFPPESNFFLACTDARWRFSICCSFVPCFQGHTSNPCVSAYYILLQQPFSNVICNLRVSSPPPFSSVFFLQHIFPGFSTVSLVDRVLSQRRPPPVLSSPPQETTSNCRHLSWPPSGVFFLFSPFASPSSSFFLRQNWACHPWPWPKFSLFFSSRAQPKALFPSSPFILNCAFYSPPMAAFRAPPPLLWCGGFWYSQYRARPPPVPVVPLYHGLFGPLFHSPQDLGFPCLVRYLSSRRVCGTAFFSPSFLVSSGF